MSGEFDDDRDGCDGHDDDSGQVLPPEHVETLMALCDEPVDPDALDLAVPLDGRWPEPRVMWQDTVFYLPDRTEIVLDEISPALAQDLLDANLETACCHHAAAVRDERLTTPSGTVRLLAHLGVPPVEDLDPVVWLESTLLMRRLRAIANGG